MIARDEVLEGTLERIRRRRAKWHTVEDDIIPEPRDLKEKAIVGIFSIAGVETQTRWLLAPRCVLTEAGLETPPSCARDYLMTKYGRSPRASHKQIEYLRATKAPLPQFAAPQFFGDGYYVDIEATFWSIMLVIGWDIDYWPGKWLGRGIRPVDFPWPKEKVARNCLVSAGGASQVTWWNPPRGRARGYFETKAGGNPIANIQLPRLMSDVLNAIAAEAVDAGAVYVNTDGYIAPNYETMARIVQAVSSWHLQPRIKAHGPGWVRGTGSYAVGGNVSKRPTLFDHPLDLVTRRPYNHELKADFTRFAEEADIE